MHPWADEFPGRLVVESTVDQLRGGSELIVRATPSDIARVVLEPLREVQGVRSYDGALRLRVDERHTALVNQTLVAAGLAVTELRRDERQLEDIFLDITDHETGREADRV